MTLDADESPARAVPHVVTVIVNFNGFPDTVACVASVLASEYPSLGVLVVDNGSSPGEAEMLRASMRGDATVLALDRNLGFGGGANVGIRAALELGASYVWILNNDTVVEPGAIDTLVSAMESESRIGLASPQITAPEGPEAPGGIWFAGGSIRLARGETTHHVIPLASSSAVDSPFLTGCALLARRDALMAVGLFWEQLFLYWEDTDIVLRMRKAGWRTAVVPDAWIHHRIHGSAQSHVVRYYHFRNAILVAWRHGGLRTAVSAGLHLAIVVARRWASAIAGRREIPTAESRGLATGLMRAITWSLRPPAAP